MLRAPHSPSISSASRIRAARAALSICAHADALALEADSEVDTAADDHRLFALLEQREVMLQDLAEQLLVLRLHRPTADSALYAATERVVDEADTLVADVCSAVSTSHRLTMALAAKVARRSEEIRAELDAVQRASTASTAYGMPGGPRLVDHLR
ncbi:MAG: hypothetical protein HEQ38_08260 [Gemmatimonas sp.]|jgi:hypothetical protein|uniref:hypothetical protein n=1 Tax=Gemmatimonas sp. TaxID=1962908 RepID=UPI0031C8D97C|nr:hypothetical protein [Gemmatimonas sp.]